METPTLTPAALESFIVRAKSATYVGGAGKIAPVRTASHDLEYQEDDLVYRDSYFGGTDFLGQETVHLTGRPVWGMNYYGYLLTEGIDAFTAGETIKTALTALYAEGRFLGGFRHTVGELTYADETVGEVNRFRGVEHIATADGTRVYELRYHGGRILD
ncbi:hypothetical protein GCM10010387_29360 [Streptomyces inusitatus]|uniref:DUF5680 domain-containing protein n=1 Tax=Streptomyces inusitatus TaxID=68221 RepID=A0A918Q7I5_9ACTN|nr:DUF5680 domain-containing protein [Streptomyces inusitatus]GGZ33346.1 hypothetical protein GCM10010387_29360 [Streptomyces inusitatus]